MQDGFPYNEARLLINELSSIMMVQLKDSINNFSKVPPAIGNNDFTFGGVYIWEYYNAPPDPKNPFLWSQIIYNNYKTI